MTKPFENEALLPLLASSLDGTQDSLVVLADFLEETGREDLARRARAPKQRLQNRLRFVLELTPKEMLLPLGCDYLSHVVDRSAEVYAPYQEARRQLHNIRNWDWKNSPLASLTRARNRLAEEIVNPIRDYWPGYENRIHSAFFRLIEATDQMISAREEALADSARDEHVASRSRSLISRAATEARNQPQDVRPRTPEETQMHRNAIRHFASDSGDVSESELAAAAALHLIEWHFGVADVPAELQWQAEQTGRVLLDSLS